MSPCRAKSCLRCSRSALHCDPLCTAAWTAADDEPQELLRTAVKTLRQARNLGGDMAVRSGEFDQAFKLWQQKAATTAGAFINLTAGDVMTPFTACWVEAAEGADLRAAIFNSGAPFVPYLDEQENYIGILPRVAFEHADPRSLRGRVETPLPAPEDLKFSELAELMTSGEEELLVVVRDGRPLGYITCEAGQHAERRKRRRLSLRRTRWRGVEPPDCRW